MTHHTPHSMLRPGHTTPWPINGDSLRYIRALDEAIELEEDWRDPLDLLDSQPFPYSPHPRRTR